MATVPTAPLLARVLPIADHPDRLAVLLDRLGYAPTRWVSSGLRKALVRRTVSVWLADRICVALELHPAVVYGASWYALDGDA